MSPPPGHWCIREPIGPQAKTYGEIAGNRVKQRMAWLDRELGTCEYIAAPRYTVADITLQCSLIAAKAIGLRIPDGHKNLARWFETVTSRPATHA